MTPSSLRRRKADVALNPDRHRPTSSFQIGTVWLFLLKTHMPAATAVQQRVPAWKVTCDIHARLDRFCSEPSQKKKKRKRKDTNAGCRRLNRTDSSGGCRQPRDASCRQESWYVEDWSSTPCRLFFLGAYLLGPGRGRWIVLSLHRPPGSQVFRCRCCRSSRCWRGCPTVSTLRRSRSAVLAVRLAVRLAVPCLPTGLAGHESVCCWSLCCRGPRWTRSAAQHRSSPAPKQSSTGCECPSPCVEPHHTDTSRPTSSHKRVLTWWTVIPPPVPMYNVPSRISEGLSPLATVLYMVGNDGQRDWFGLLNVLPRTLLGRTGRRSLEPRVLVLPRR